MIHATAIVDKTANIDSSVEIGPYVIIGKDVSISKGCSIGAFSIIEYAEILSECQIAPQTIIGATPQDFKYKGKKTKVIIKPKCIIREYTTIHRGSITDETVIGEECYLMAYSHVAHDCVLGTGVVMANCATLGGHVVIEDYAVLGGLVAVHQFVRIGKLSFLGGGAMASQDVPPFTIACGDRARLYGLNIVGLKRHNYSEEHIRNLKYAYKVLFHSKKPQSQTLEQLSNEYLGSEVEHLINFIRNSRRGICHPKRK